MLGPFGAFAFGGRGKQLRITNLGFGLAAEALLFWVPDQVRDDKKISSEIVFVCLDSRLRGNDRGGGI